MTLDVEAAHDRGAEDRRRAGPAGRRDRRGRASSTSSTRTCSARCGSCRCSRATTRATSRSSRSAAPGPLHANALAQLLGSLAGDHAAEPRRALRLRRRDDEPAQRERRARSSGAFSETSDAEVRGGARRAGRRGAGPLDAEGVAARGPDGQLPGRRALPRAGLRGAGRRRPRAVRERGAGRASAGPFDAEHTRLFTFALDAEHELVNLRAVVHRPAADGGNAPQLRAGRRRPVGGPVPTPTASTSTAAGREAGVYDRAEAARRQRGRRARPIVTEMDSTTLSCPATPATWTPSATSSSARVCTPIRRGSHADGHASSRPTRRRSSRVDVDPVTLDIVENALRNARYEMDAVLFRTAMSPGIREQHDEFPLIADPHGKMVVGQFGSSIPGFLAGFDGDDRGGRHPPDVRPLLVRRRDQPRQRLARAAADLPRTGGSSAGSRCSAT